MRSSHWLKLPQTRNYAPQTEKRDVMDTEPDGRHLSFQALLLSIVGLLLITLGAFGFSTWYALQQWPQLTQSTQSLKTVSTNLSTAFDQYDGTLNMYVSLDPDSGAPPGLQRTTLATAIQDRDNFFAAYRQALRLSRGSPLTGDLTPVGMAFTAYQDDASLVIRDMQHQHYRQALHLQAIGNVAVSQALASALARFNGDTARFIQMKESRLQTVLHRMRIVLIFWGILMLTLTGLGLTALRRATRELVQDLLALTHGNFMMTRPPAFWKEYALIHHAFLEMRDTIAASFATLVTVTQNQASYTGLRILLVFLTHEVAPSGHSLVHPPSQPRALKTAPVSPQGWAADCRAYALLRQDRRKGLRRRRILFARLLCHSGRSSADPGTPSPNPRRQVPKTPLEAYRPHRRDGPNVPGWDLEGGIHLGSYEKYSARACGRDGPLEYRRAPLR